MECNKKLLFNPGPTNVSESVRNALRTEDICHREKEFAEVLIRVNKNLIKLFNGEGTHESVIFISSGTGSNEAIINGINGKILVINNGKYSKRILEIINRYHIPNTDLVFDPNRPVDLDIIEEQLKKDSSYTHIFVVHHETTTGIISPIHEIGLLAKKYNVVFCVDSISGLGGHPFDLKNDNIGFCSVSANKCLESFPGVSMVLCKAEEIKKLKGQARSFYFDLYSQWEKELKGETPFTPAVQLIYALDIAIKEFIEEGYENRIKRYEGLALRMRQGLQKLGFELLLMPDDIQSNILTSIIIPENINYWDMHDRLKDRGITIYSDNSVLSHGRFRVATMGSITNLDIDFFLHSLEQVIKELSNNK